jgi:DNA-binding HxlR family transcriptional regulator
VAENARRREEKTARQDEGAAGSVPRAGTTAPTAAPLPVDLDRLIHERLRLAIVSALAVNASLTFNELKGLLATTDGNLSVHARKLEEAEYIGCRKSFKARKPRTEYRLLPKGRRALDRYLEHMDALIRATRGD